jgi:hypothetical protein
MGKYIISKLENEFIFWGKKKLILSMWKLSLGYSMLIICPATTPQKQLQGFTRLLKRARERELGKKRDCCFLSSSIL